MFLLKFYKYVCKIIQPHVTPQQPCNKRNRHLYIQTGGRKLRLSCKCRYYNEPHREIHYKSSSAKPSNDETDYHIYTIMPAIRHVPCVCDWVAHDDRTTMQLRCQFLESLRCITCIYVTWCILLQSRRAWAPTAGVTCWWIISRRHGTKKRQWRKSGSTACKV